MSRWTEEQDQALIAGVNAGHSSTMIGRTLDKTRSAIIGRCYRLGLPLPGCRSPRPERVKGNVVPLRVGAPAHGDQWEDRVQETWEQRKARRRLEKVLNGDDLRETGHWAATFAFETRDSMRAALGVLAGRLADPDLFRNVADRLEATISKPNDGRAA